MEKSEKMLESRGYHEFDRIGRPDIMYDSRTKYSSSISEFDRSMKERTRGAHTVVAEKVAVEEDE